MNAFVTVKSPEHLLSIAGFHSRLNGPSWRHLVCKVLYPDSKSPIPEEIIQKEIKKVLKELLLYAAIAK